MIARDGRFATVRGHERAFFARTGRAEQRCAATEELVMQRGGKLVTVALTERAQSCPTAKR